MKHLFNFVLDYIQHSSLYHLMFNVLCLLFLLVSWLLLSELIRQYVSIKGGCNFASLGEFIDGVFAVYGTHVIIFIWVLYYYSIIIYNSGGAIAQVITNTLAKININVGEHELLYMGSAIPLNMGGEGINNIDNTTVDISIKENTMCIIEKAVKIGRNNINIGGRVPLNVLQFHNNLTPPIISPPVGLYEGSQLKPKIPVEDMDFIIHPNLAEQEEYLHDIINLHEFKKLYPQYRDKELIFIHTPTASFYKNYLHMGDIDTQKLMGIADAVIYDKGNDTIIAIQYKASLGYRFDKIADSSLSTKYQNTHLMNITLFDGGKFYQMVDIIQNHQCNFDTVVQTYNPNVNINSLQEIAQLNHEFMQEHGNLVRERFYYDYYNKDYSKFQCDTKFVYEFHEFTKARLEGNGLSELIPGVKSNE